MIRTLARGLDILLTVLVFALAVMGALRLPSDESRRRRRPHAPCPPTRVYAPR